MLNIAEAQELHEIIGAAIEQDYWTDRDLTDLYRARELAALLLSDIENQG